MNSYMTTNILFPASVIRDNKGGRMAVEELDARYRWIESFVDLNGIIPSYQAMASGWGVTRAAIKTTLLAMERRGWLKRYPGIPRGIKLMRQGVNGGTE